MRKAFIHEKGEKGERDRATCAMEYRQLCDYFRVRRMRDAEIAKLSTLQFYNMCRDIFDRQSQRAQRKYAEALYGETNVKYRLHPFAFRWYYADLMRFGGGPGFVRALLSPFTYVRFLARKAKRAKAKLVEKEAKDEGADENAKNENAAK